MTMHDMPAGPALDIVRRLRSGESSAVEIIGACLADIEAGNPGINAFVHVAGERALREAAALDRRLRSGEDLPALAGVPIAVKDLFDIAGETTHAGSQLRAGAPVARRDAAAVARLREAGAIVVGRTNMDAFAYGFVTDNARYGPTRNPADPSRIAGGSSGGSAAAVAAGMVPIGLGTDTNGSVRVPAALCGIWAFKPSYGRIPTAGVFPLARTLDHVGHFASSLADLELGYTVLSGERTAGPDSEAGRLRVARLGGYFDAHCDETQQDAAASAAERLGAGGVIEWPDVEAARAAALLITAAEGAVVHARELLARPGDFDPACRDRLLAGAQIPAHWYISALDLRARFAEQVAACFAKWDVLVAPAVPCAAPALDALDEPFGAERWNARASLGLLTQPISFIGLPVLCAPVGQTAVQLIGAPDQEATLFRAAARLKSSSASLP